MTGRLDYVKYDDHAYNMQLQFKAMYERALSMVESLPLGRAKALALTKLEESYMWVGKALRDDQVVRNGTAPLMEERKNG